MKHAMLAMLAAVATVGCASGPPARFVLEQDAGPYTFRRYQKSLDAEIPVEGNPATAHLATYVKGGSAVRVAPVTVTVYATSEGLADAVRTVVRAMPGYTYGVEKRHGEWLWSLKGEQDDDWLLWPSGAQLVKLGVPEDEDDVPEVLLEAYLDRYPSDLDKSGKARD